jgi:hypothetical protein
MTAQFLSMVQMRSFLPLVMLLVVWLNGQRGYAASIIALILSDWVLAQ